MSPAFDIAPVRIGVAGLGRSGMYHVDRIGLRDDCRVVALYDDCPSARRRADVAGAATPEAWREFLGDAQVELVLLATPPALHAELTIQALAAGKHVVVETPMCLDLTEAGAIIAASARTGRSVSVAQTRRWDDDFRTAWRTVQEGALGRPAAMKFINWHYNPHSLRSAGLAPQPDHPGGEPAGLAAVDWRQHALSGGGVLWESGIHCFDQLLQLAGRPPQSVYARCLPTDSGERPDELPDEGFLAIVDFPGNLVAHIEVQGAVSAPLSTGWTIAGDRASYAGFTLYTPGADGEVVDVPLSPATEQADDFYGQVFRQIRCGAPNPVPPEEARQVIAVIEAVRRSARCGQAVAVEA